MDEWGTGSTAEAEMRARLLATPPILNGGQTRTLTHGPPIL